MLKLFRKHVVIFTGIWSYRFLAIFLLQCPNGQLRTLVDVIRNGYPFPEKPNTLRKKVQKLSLGLSLFKR